MAEIEFYLDDNEDTQGDGDDSGLGCDDYDSCNPDDNLSPLQKLEKYMDSENIFSRQMVARSLLDTLRLVGDDENDANTVLKAMVRLAEDPEPTVRAELMEQLPHIAVFCHDNAHLFFQPIATYILPIITKYLTDAHNQVRKTSQAALIVLLEQDLVDKKDVEEQVCPIILDLSSPDSIDDFRTEAGALMSKMAPLVGKDMTERLFMPRFCEMCTDSLFHVRKVCAANFGDVCEVVGQENTEHHLLPKFMYLCEDGVWGVRKACAECFMPVSCVCSPQVRRSDLAQLFSNLICDQSRWVRMAAFQALGGFISTFADPAITGLYLNEEGLLVAGQSEKGILESLEERGAFTLEKGNEEKSLGNCILQPEDEKSCAGRNPHNDANNRNNLEEVSNKNCDLEVSSDSRLATDCLTSSTPMEIDECVGASDIELGDESVSCAEGAGAGSTVDPSNEVSVEEVRAKRYGSDAAGQTEEGAAQEDTTPVEAGASEDACSFQIDQESSITSTDTENNVQNTVIGDNESCPTNEIVQDESSLSHETTDRELSPANNIDELNDFNTFNFWRSPLPEINIDVDLQEEEAKARMRHSLLEESTTVHTAQEVHLNEETAANIASTHVLGTRLNESSNLAIIDGVVQDMANSSLTYDDSPPDSPEMTLEHPYLQDVIPQHLLEHYLSMTDPSRAQTVDSEIARHCAYSLPAVAYTLGRKYWPCLKDLYETLAADMQWKVRRTLAFSIHELAVILGEEITTQDLVPVFNGFLKDLDEVRVGVLKHLADFLRLLKPDTRRDYLTKIPDFLNTDNSRNWRFREDLAEQLVILIELYSAQDIREHLFPIAVLLGEDKVAYVRHTAYRVLAGMLRRFAKEDRGLVHDFVTEMTRKFARSNKWNRRQIYAQVCGFVLTESALDVSLFADELFPCLLELAKDPIPNVRIALAKTLSENVLSSDWLTSPSDPYHETLLETVKMLQTDGDRDVRYFITYQPDRFTELSNKQMIQL